MFIHTFLKQIQFLIQHYIALKTWLTKNLFLNCNVTNSCHIIHFAVISTVIVVT